MADYEDICKIHHDSDYLTKKMTILFNQDETDIHINLFLSVQLTFI